MALFVSVIAESLFRYQARDPDSESEVMVTDEEIVTALMNLKDGRPLGVLSSEYQLAFTREFTALDKKFDWLTWVTVSFFTRAGDSMDFTDALVESLLQGLDLDGPDQRLNHTIPGWRMFGMGETIKGVRDWLGFTGDSQASPIDTYRLILRNNKHLIINLLAIIAHQPLTEITNGVSA